QQQQRWSGRLYGHWTTANAWQSCHTNSVSNPGQRCCDSDRLHDRGGTRLQTVKLRLHRVSAFSLVEVTLALGVASFSLLAILALIPASLSTNQQTVQQTADTNFVRSIAADLLTTPLTTQTSP